VAQRDLAVGAVDQNRLRVRQLALPSGRIAHVADRQPSRQLRERRGVECVGDVAHRARNPHAFEIGRRDACALLSPMLQGIEPEIGHVGGFGMAEDAEDAALVSEFVEHYATRLAK